MMRRNTDGESATSSECIEERSIKDVHCERESSVVSMMQLLPVLFVFGIVLFLVVVYMYHISLKISIHPANGACIELIAFCLLFSCLATSYARAALTSPGAIPDSSEWLYGSGAETTKTLESKRSGQRRYCKWCEKYKPDRGHHCRVCKTCVLKMDHHCPWLHNCVGFRNHKYFLLLIFYSAILSTFVSVSMFPTALTSTSVESTNRMILFLSGETLALFLAVFMTLFLIFHVWMFLNGMTTIEFCEKSLKKNFRSQYNLGFRANLYKNLGPHWYLWLLPLSAPTGDGCHYEADEECLTFVPKDFKRQTKQSVQEV